MCIYIYTHTVYTAKSRGRVIVRSRRFICVCMHACIYMYVCIYVCMYECMHACICDYICMHVLVHTHVYIKRETYLACLCGYIQHQVLHTYPRQFGRLTGHVATGMHEMNMPWSTESLREGGPRLKTPQYSQVGPKAPLGTPRLGPSPQRPPNGKIQEAASFKLPEDLSPGMEAFAWN